MQQNDETSSDALKPDPLSTEEPADQAEDLTRWFVRLTNLPTYPIDRLSRYEATLWRRTCRVSSRCSVSTAANRGKDKGCVEPSATLIAQGACTR